MNAKTGWVALFAMLSLMGCSGEQQSLGDVGGGSAGNSGSGGAAAGSANNGGTGVTDTGLASCETQCFRNIVNATATGCKVCHGSVIKLDMSTLDLETSGISARLKDAPAEHKGLVAPTTCPQGDKLIDSANPEASWLLKKVLGQQGNCGTPMPSTGALSAADQQCMSTYVHCVAGR